MSTARQRSSKNFSASMNQHETIEELLYATFSAWSVPTLYIEDHREGGRSRRLEFVSFKRAVAVRG
jgi:hypothetical protein